MFIVGYAGWPAYYTFLIVSLSGRSIYDPNSLRPNPNPKKHMSGSCRVHGLGRTLTPLCQLCKIISNFRELSKLLTCSLPFNLKSTINYWQLSLMFEILLQSWHIIIKLFKNKTTIGYLIGNWLMRG